MRPGDTVRVPWYSIVGVMTEGAVGQPLHRQDVINMYYSYVANMSFLQAKIQFACWSSSEFRVPAMLKTLHASWLPSHGASNRVGSCTDSEEILRMG